MTVEPIESPSVQVGFTTPEAASIRAIARALSCGNKPTAEDAAVLHELCDKLKEQGY